MIADSSPCPSRARPTASGTSARSRSAATRWRSSSASSPRSGSASGAGWPAAAGRARSRTSRSGRCRSAWSAAGSTTWSPTPSSTSATAATRGSRSTSGRAASASGARSPSARVGAIIARRRRGIGSRRWPTRWRPASLVAQAIGRWGNWFNQELFGKPTDLPWALEIDPAHRPPGYEDRARRSTRRSSTSASGTSAVFGAADLGRPAVQARPRAGVRALRDGLHRSAAAGSRSCASTPSSSTTCSGCGSTCGPRSCCSSCAAAYFVVSLRLRPGQEESVYGDGPRAPSRPTTADGVEHALRRAP